MELIKLYFRLGKIVSENAKYGNNFIKDFSIALKLEFPDSTGFSTRNLSRMKKFMKNIKIYQICQWRWQNCRGHTIIFF